MKKKKRIDPQAYIGITSIVITGAGMLWIGGFQHSTIMHEIQDIKKDIKEINARLDRMDARFEVNSTEHRNMDLRLNNLEQQRKP